jgi:hypothetical protein
MFIYSLPLFFSYTSFGSPLELLIIFVTLYIVLYLSVPFADKEWETEPFTATFYNYCLYAWTARLSLSQIFWPFFLLFNSGIYAADYAIRAGLFTVASWDDIHFMLFVFATFWSIAVWRNSINSNTQIWMALARLITLAVLLEFIMKIVLRINYPRVLFNCTERVLNYLVCF